MIARQGETAAGTSLAGCRCGDGIGHPEARISIQATHVGIDVGVHGV